MVKLNKLARKRLGEILVEEGLVTPDQVDAALDHQKDTAELLGECMIKMGFVTEGDIASALSKQYGLPYIDVSAYQIQKEVIGLISPEIMTQNQLIPLDKIGKVIIIAVSGTIDPAVFEDIEQKTGSETFLYVSTVTQVTGALRKHISLAAGK